MLEEDVNDVERDLAALMAVEPSAAFAVGVRGRIASAPGRHTRLGWTWAAAAAALILAVAAIATATRDRARPVEIATAVPLSRQVPPAMGPVPTPRSAREPRPARVAPGRRPVAEVREAEVIVDPEVGRAVQRLFRMVQTKAADAALATVAETAVTDPPHDLGVTPMVVDDLTVKSIAGAERR